MHHFRMAHTVQQACTEHPSAAAAQHAPLGMLCAAATATRTCMRAFDICTIAFTSPYANLEIIRPLEAAWRPAQLQPPCPGRWTSSALRERVSKRCAAIGVLTDGERNTLCLCCLLLRPLAAAPHWLPTPLQIRSLVGALQEGPLGPKFGVSALPRHLRRRAGSHKPFHGHRFRPNAKLQSKRLKLQGGEVEAADGAAGSAAPGALPGSNPEGAEPRPGSSAAAARPFTNRRMRRTPAALAEQHRQLACWSEASLAASAAWAEAPGGIGSGSGGRARRLETHVWHAKRLAMEER